MPEETTQLETQEESPEQKYARLYAQAAQEVQQKNPIVATLPQDVVDTLAAMRQEIGELKASQTPKAAEVQNAWVDKIRQGDYEGAERVLTNKVQEAMKPTLEEVRQQAYKEAVSAAQVNLEIDRHIQSVRLQNPDIVQFEKYLTPAINQRVEEAKTAGKIKTHQDYVRETKTAIDAEVSELTKLGLVLRGQAKQEAQVRNQQILASTPLTPTQVQSTQVADTSQQEPNVTVEDYFARRRADEMRRRGLSQ